VGADRDNVIKPAAFVKKTGVVILPFVAITVAVRVFASAPFSYVSHGFPAAGGEHPNVTLTSADVDIVLGAGTVSVSASFTFVNDGPAAVIAVDYPLVSRGGKYSLTETEVRRQITRDFGEFPFYEETVDGPFRDIEARRTPDVSLISDESCLGEYGPSFTVSVDGEPAAFSLEEFLSVYVEEGVTVAWTENSTVARLSVPFAKSEQRTITYEYELGYELFAGKIYPELRYALYPGATWAGDIGRATVSVRRPAGGFDRPIWFSAEYLGGLAPATFAYGGDTEVFTWYFEGYDPPEFVELNILLGVPPENYGTFFKDILGMYGAGSGTRVFGRTVADGVPFMKGPSPNAESVNERPYLPEDTLFVIIGSEGEWWKIRADGAAEGWIRWRSVDPTTGEEHVYAEFFAY
jgi:hypothetical protein